MMVMPEAVLVLIVPEKVEVIEKELTVTATSMVQAPLALPPEMAAPSNTTVAEE